MQNNSLQCSNNPEDQELRLITYNLREVISFVQTYAVKMSMVAHVGNPCTSARRLGSRLTSATKGIFYPKPNQTKSDWKTKT